MIVKKLLLSIVLGLLVFNSFAQKETDLLLEREVVYFESGKSDLATSALSQINKLVKYLEANPKTFIWVLAHTDSIGNYDFNKKLAQKRAAVIIQVLKSKEITDSRIKTNSYGEILPDYANNTAKGRAKNRRVCLEIVRNYTPKDKNQKENPMFWLKGKVRDAVSKDVLSNIMVILEGMGGIDTVMTNENGDYEFVLPQPTRGHLKACGKKFFFVEQLINVVANTPTEVDFSLNPTTLGTKIKLGGLYFQSGTAELLTESEKTLKSTFEFLKQNADLKVEIGGHINKPGAAVVSETSTSFLLSKNRAKAVYNYLTSKGIKGDQITYKGYGNSQMIYAKPTSIEQEQANRRVELKIIK